MDYLLQQRLIPWIAPPQAVEPDLARSQAHLRTDQPVGPVSGHVEGPPQHLGPTLGVGPPYVHHPAPEPILEVQPTALRERSRGGAASIRSALCRRNAATWRPDRSVSPSRSAYSNRAQARACQEQLWLSI